MTNKPTKAGFVAIIGAPNAGKSTLVNALVGEKVSIVTHKIQTTRFQIRAIAIYDNAQIILLDTPGIFKPVSEGNRQRLARSMVHAAWSGAGDADVIVHVIDAPAFLRCKQEQATAQDKKAHKDTKDVIKGLIKRKDKRQVYLVLNKIDEMQKSDLLLLLENFKNTNIYTDIFMLSALSGDGVSELKQVLAEAMPKGDFLYPPDQSADIPMRLMAAEITREKLFLRLHDELPYDCYIETESWKRQKNSIRIDQVIYVRRKSQKPIVLGKNGQTIKQIGQMAREEMQDIFAQKVHLFLFVKVRADWQDDKSKYVETGLEYNV